MRRGVSKAADLTRGMDSWLMIAFLGLMCVGILMVYSSSIDSAYVNYGSPFFFFEREIIYVILGLGTVLAAVKIHYHHWQRFALPLFIAGVALVALVMVPHVGHMSHGARRWISVSSFLEIEPSELVKLGLVVYLAAWLASKGERVRDFKACFVPFGLMVGMIALFIVKQPDLGTAIVVTAIAVAIFFVAGASLQHMAAVGAGAAGIGWLLVQGSGYRHDRFTAFLDPWHDPSGVGYHIIQALLALRSGGLFGQGLGNGTEKAVLPAPDTDSILAVIGEEWGLIGTLLVLALFLVVAYRGMLIASNAPDAFGRLLATGVTSWITFQAFMNFAVITSSVPFTGVPLPFVSYGGTSLVITMAAMGILLNISRHASGAGFAYQGTTNGWRNRRTRVPRVVHHPVPVGARSSISRRHGPESATPAPVKRARERARRSNARAVQRT